MSARAAGAGAEARRAGSAIARAAGAVRRAPWLALPALAPALAAKYLPEPSAGPGLGAALTRVWPVAVAAAALALFALPLRGRLGWRPARLEDEVVMSSCYLLVALLIASFLGGLASARFSEVMLANVRADFALWARLSALFALALQLAGMAWLALVASGLPSVPRHPELFGALARGFIALARRPAAAAAWVALAAAGDWLLARGGGRLALAASAGDAGSAALVGVAWSRQLLAYVVLCGAPLCAAEDAP